MEPFDDPDWLFEMKYDGYRALCYVEPRRDRLISRNNNIMTRFDPLADQVAAALEVDDAILDGEIIASDETKRPQFYDLLRGKRPPAYVAFLRQLARYTKSPGIRRELVGLAKRYDRRGEYFETFQSFRQKS
jgi:ATP-dependent DNA ligase